jgi:peptidoglycan hydrolase-like protein with peptidoglycan-binding domain
METLAYIHLACSYEESDAIEPSFTPKTIKIVRGSQARRPYSRACIHLLSLLAASTVLGMATQAQAQLIQGSRGNQVEQLQQQLRELGYFDRPSTGNFGPRTKQAVIRFQQDEGLTADGVVETRTKTALLRRLGRSDSEVALPTPSPNSTPIPTPDKAANPDPVRRITLKRGDKGTEVEALQKLLTAAGVYEGTVTGKFDGKTVTAVRRFQRNNRLGVDGVVGARTWSVLLDPNGTSAATGPFNKDPFTNGDETVLPPAGNNAPLTTGETATLPPTDNKVPAAIAPQDNALPPQDNPIAGSIQQGSRGTAVRELQQRLRELGYFNGRTTGNFGPLTKAAVIQFQQDSGLNANGIVDEPTKEALQKKTGSAANISVKQLQERLKDKGFFNGEIDGNMNEQTKAAIKAAQQAYGVSEDDILKARF